MAYETKVTLKLLHAYAKKAESKEEIIKLIEDAANAEGVVIAPDSDN